MFLGYEVGRVAKALVAALPAVLLFLVFTTLAMLLLPSIPPKLWYLFGFVAVVLYIGEKWKGTI